MELRKFFAPTAAMVFPFGLRQKIFDETWLKSQFEVTLRDHEEALSVKTLPVPYLEVLFKVQNNLPNNCAVFGVTTEVWLGKPVVQAYTPLSQNLRAGETSEGLRAAIFLNNYQLDILKPQGKDVIPPRVTVNLTVSVRTPFGTIDKTVKSSWLSPKASR